MLSGRNVARSTWPCPTSDRDVRQINDEETFRKCHFALETDAGAP